MTLANVETLSHLKLFNQGGFKLSILSQLTFYSQIERISEIN